MVQCAVRPARHALSAGGTGARPTCWTRMILLTGFFAALFAAVHLGIGALTFLDRTPRSRWLSAAGGVAVAYVFLHILPELASHRRTFAEELGTSEETAERLVYSLALAGLAVFYGLERALKTSRQGNRREDPQELPPAGTFWLHIASFKRQPPAKNEWIMIQHSWQEFQKRPSCRPTALRSERGHEPLEPAGSPHAHAEARRSGSHGSPDRQGCGSRLSPRPFHTSSLPPQRHGFRYKRRRARCRGGNRQGKVHLPLSPAPAPPDAS